MKSFIFILTLALVTAAPQISTNAVSVFKGKSSKKYHLKKNCRVLSNCARDISEILQTANISS